jgi:hypothetical protein
MEPHTLLIQSSFNTAVDVVAYSFPIAGWVIRRAIPFELDSVENLKGYDLCYYQFHSRKDEVVPFSLAEKLWKSVDTKAVAPAYDGCKTSVFVPDGKHTEPITSTIETIQIPMFINLTRNLPSVY